MSSLFPTVTQRQTNQPSYQKVFFSAGLVLLLVAVGHAEGWSMGGQAEGSPVN